MRRNDFEKARTADQMREDLTALKLQLAFQEEFEAELAEIEAMAENPDPELKELMDRSDGRMKKLFDREYKKSSMKRIMFHFMPKVAKAAAIIITVGCVGLTAAMAAVPPFRAGVLEFVTAVTARYITLDTDGIQDPVEVPDEWEGKYYPTYIPEGFELKWIDGKSARYQNSEGRKLYFKEYERDINYSLDGEDGIIERVQLMDCTEAFVIKKDKWRAIIWSQQDTYMIVYGYQSKSELMKIAENVISVRN